MEVNDNAGSQIPRGALRFFASKLAPTRVAILAIFRTKKSAFPKVRSLSFAGHFLDHFARLRLPKPVASLGPSLLISDRV
ncbi:conserved hypothetical protein [Pseudomonas jessenii]|jgi:hypothetical protein|uniref:Uncharacterized protein n=1 Tax=Pseudomonas fluorescens TaxID=294 RepID=A0A5E7PMU8_PSEFL|nr:hypothetical protein PS673_01073 [Pseudomonas fluorescens]VVP50609.1 hypothetical protein PS843_05289 [Pseudomonas fluorescens]